MKNIYRNLSEMTFHLDRDFIKNILIVVGVITIWRSLWSVLPISNPLISSMIAMTIGMVLLYLPENSLQQLISYIKTQK